MATSSAPILEDSTRALLDSVSRLDALQDPESDDDDNEDQEHIYDDDSLSDTFGEAPHGAVEEAREKPAGRGLVIPQNYKTQLCRNWEKDKDCPYGKRCVFAHDLCELRTIQINLVAMAHVAWMRQGKDVYGRPGIMAGPPDPNLYSVSAPMDPNANAPFWYPQQYSEFMPAGPGGFAPGFPPPAGELVWHEREEKKKKKKEKKDKKDKKHKKHKKHKKEKRDKEGEGREEGEGAEKKSKKHKKHKKHKKKDSRKEEAKDASSDSDTDAQPSKLS